MFEVRFVGGWIICISGITEYMEGEDKVFGSKGLGPSLMTTFKEGSKRLHGYGKLWPEMSKDRLVWLTVTLNPEP